MSNILADWKEYLRKTNIYRVSKKPRNDGFSVLCNPNVSHVLASLDTASRDEKNHTTTIELAIFVMYDFKLMDVSSAIKIIVISHFIHLLLSMWFLLQLVSTLDVYISCCYVGQAPESFVVKNNLFVNRVCMKI